ncbi:hypothetical protein MXD61_01555 [Frankia sp. AgPm24]|uniref:Prenyltransferase n=1 Tax=Frankia umida TaxID=573489 RepID=A0ABT0JU38_9ACTN|nr:MULTISPECIES: hypothetical protein [Frankia]MCK9875056.1 hypothetical protein [Frankia umida]MCK9920605.1 hypothetical protein [Frankia sp. AgPm24]
MRSVESAPVLDSEALTATAKAIAAVQEADGAIPWYPGGHTDAWDHLECAMALDLCGQVDAADAAWDWLCRNQRADGSWATSYLGGAVREDFVDSNQCAYVAAAALHRWLLFGDEEFVTGIWPVVRRALDFVAALQAPTGQIWWARSADGAHYPEALLTGCSSTLHSLRCGMALAAVIDEIGSDGGKGGGRSGESGRGRAAEASARWGRAADDLHHALLAHPEYFLPKDRWSMDWYYPVLGGALRGSAGQARLASQWDTFVVTGLGARCVADEPWVTGAETCELAIALHMVGETESARRLVTDMQCLRHADGGYWTGWQFADEVFWPVEQSTWTGAAVILAVDTLAGGVTEQLFRGDDLPATALTALTARTCGCQSQDAA